MIGYVTVGVNDLENAAIYFPIVGLAVGLTAGGVYALAVTLWTPILAVLLSIGATVWMTGALHEDGLADAFDGFGGGWDRAQVLAIMKDSRIGSYALVGFSLVLAAKVAALSSIATIPNVASVTRALVAAHVLGRWSSVPLMRAYPYARAAVEAEPKTAGRVLTAAVTPAQLAVATTVMFAIVALALGWRAVPVILVSLTIIWLAGKYFARRIGGITGAALGATNQAVELSVYLVLAAHLG